VCNLLEEIMNDKKLGKFLDNMEHGGWWKARILADELAAMGGECPHTTRAVSGVPGGGRFKATCCACGKVAYTDGLSYRIATEWESEAGEQGRGEGSAPLLGEKLLRQVAREAGLGEAGLELGAEAGLLEEESAEASDGEAGGLGQAGGPEEGS
jgi:hypothetical protein